MLEQNVIFLWFDPAVWSCRVGSNLVGEMGACVTGGEWVKWNRDQAPGQQLQLLWNAEGGPGQERPAARWQLVMVSVSLSTFGRDFRELYSNYNFNQNLLKSLFLSWEIFEKSLMCVRVLLLPHLTDTLIGLFGLWLTLKRSHTT